jgi:hypothetical protein
MLGKFCNRQKKFFSVLVRDYSLPYLSPLILFASCMSLFIQVILLACRVHSWVSSIRPTKKASVHSCRADRADGWNLDSGIKSTAKSRTSLWKGNFLITRSVFLWYFLISLRATVPGRFFLGLRGTSSSFGACFLTGFSLDNDLAFLVVFLAIALVLAIFFQLGFKNEL